MPFQVETLSLPAMVSDGDDDDDANHDDADDQLCFQRGATGNSTICVHRRVLPDQGSSDGRYRLD